MVTPMGTRLTVKRHQKRFQPLDSAARVLEWGVASANGRIELPCAYIEEVLVRLGEGEQDWSQLWPFWRSIVAAARTHPYRRTPTSAAARELWLLPSPARSMSRSSAAGYGRRCSSSRTASVLVITWQPSI